MVDIKSKTDIEKMRIAGKLASEVLEMIGQHVKPGDIYRRTRSNMP